MTLVCTALSADGVRCSSVNETSHLTAALGRLPCSWCAKLAHGILSQLARSRTLATPDYSSACSAEADMQVIPADFGF
jgi:hypothetical protein